MRDNLDATLARLKVGDEVTATFHENVIGGKVMIQGAGIWSIRGTVYGYGADLRVGSRTLRFSDGLRRPWLIDLVIEEPAPDPEPPIGSVVIDDDGDAWQCFWGGSGQLWRSTGIGKPWTWERLSDTCGPLRVIYTPKATP